MRIDLDSQKKLSPLLSKGEKLLWAGQPKQGFMWSEYEWYVLPFTLFWCGFLVVWYALAIGNIGNIFEGGLLATLSAIPHLLVGFYLAFGRFYIDAKRRKKTWYGLTNQRAIISSGLFSNKLKSFELKQLGEISFNEKSRGRGNITFGTEISIWNNQMAIWTGGNPNRFIMIENAKEIYSLIRQTQQKAND